MSAGPSEKLASFAVIEEKSRGRLHQENDDDYKYRSVFGRDRDRIINSSAFRRLQYKTQVFSNLPIYQGDHHRTRLTHSLEVAQIARWIASGLSVNKDLAELVALIHDFGHPPFGHAGEEVLSQKMAKFGGFSHNAHALKLVTKIETRFIEFEGLNLSWEILEGGAKHNGPRDFVNESGNEYILEYDRIHNLDLTRYSSAEAQISAIADDIAYNNHDIEDGLRAGLFTVEDLLELPIVSKVYRALLAKYPKSRRELLVGEAKKKLTLLMVIDAIENTRKNLRINKIKTEADVRNSSKQLVYFSEELELAHQQLKKFLMSKMYRHPLVNRMKVSAKKIVGGLFDFYFDNPNCLPLERKELSEKMQNPKELAILVSDYIAGMTDRFAAKEYDEI